MNNKIFSLKKILSASFLTLLLASFIVPPSNASVELFNRRKDGLYSDLALNIFITENNVWFSSSTSGAAMYDKNLRKFTIYDNKSKVVSGTVESVVVAFGKTWFGTNDGINVMDSEGNVTLISEVDYKSTVRKDRDMKASLYGATALWYKGGALWTCSYKATGGLYRYDGEKWEEVRFGKSVFNYVNDLEVIGDEIWFATISYGIYIYNTKTKKWSYINSGESAVVNIPSNSIQKLAVSGDTVWAATSMGVCEIVRDGATFKVNMYDEKNTDGAIKSPNSTSVAVTESGDVYVGNMMGIAKFTNGKWEEVKITNDKGQSLNVRKIYSLENDGDTVWAGTSVGIIKMD